LAGAGIAGGPPGVADPVAPAPRPAEGADPGRPSGVSGPRRPDRLLPPGRWRAQAPPAGGWRLHTPPLEWRGLRAPPRSARLILDLCAGTGAWSQPYVEAGYRVVRVTLPDDDVRLWKPPRDRAWGVLAAPPCQRFSRATRAAHTTAEHLEGMECVNACLRIVLASRPAWWALENPHHGDLSRFLGLPQWSFSPWEFGDPWTKPTALWGEFSPPCDRRPVVPTGSAMDRRSAEDRAVTPPGFAAAFFRANQ
jgi:hypothetical protein